MTKGDEEQTTTDDAAPRFSNEKQKGEMVVRLVHWYDGNWTFVRTTSCEGLLK